MKALLYEVCSKGGFCGGEKWHSLADFEAIANISEVVFANKILELEGMDPEHHSDHVKYLKNKFSKWFGEGQSISIGETLQ